ncbi:NAD(+) diphosphatase [Saccharomonospora glauca]|jgi:NAD+ diphosphatase|uniref:NAD(+) diphosphatase n=1 Tax=Saccharomonospora glauca K62 TaxID=928724 RepID=I1CYD6_9PSEU|nr:NAD(+) diphosphatase [Saccharomonospora glauca]EIE97710.1 Zn-finger containing NTP pyrophosphohydrolase [Saccharomonospora glauca K62]
MSATSQPSPFRLTTLPALSRSTADRQESLRTDPERLRARWPSARVVRLDSAGRVPVPEDALLGHRSGGVPLATTPALDVAEEVPEEAVFLGRWEDTDYWAVLADPAGPGRRVGLDGGWGLPVEVTVVGNEAWVDLRAHGAVLDDTAAGLLTTAVALRNWHRRARYCARCGGRTTLHQFGWASTCEQCGREEYPRTDPAVICLVHDDVGVNGENVLLARQPTWPPNRYSVLAGFVEAGESLERCVEREIREEVGVAVRDVRYLGSQPWPFPRSIMMGFAARADAVAPLTPARGEIENAQWVSRERVRAALAGNDPELLLPGETSIAHVMVRAWAEARN